MSKRKWIFILVLFVCLTSCNRPFSSLDQTRDIVEPYVPWRPCRTWIDAPLTNYNFPLRTVKIAFHSSSIIEGTEFQLWINGEFIETALPHTTTFGSSEYYALYYTETLWTPPGPGDFAIEVRTITDGELCNREGVVIRIVELDVESTPTEEVDEVCTYTASVNLNCRAGPGGEYESIGFFLPNQSSPILGKSGDDIYWYVDAPDSGERCTVPNNTEYGITEGDCTNIPEVIEPTPTPEPTPNEEGCTVEVLGALGGVVECVVPCPEDAVPGDPCTPEEDD